MTSPEEPDTLERERTRARDWSHDQRDTLRITLCIALAMFCMWRIQATSTPLNITQYYTDVVTDGPESRFQPEPYEFWMDLNQATSTDLRMLPRIGPKLAGRIIEYREKNGDFEDVTDLLNVRGIGAKTLEGIAPFLRVQTTEENQTNTD